MYHISVFICLHQSKSQTVLATKHPVKKCEIVAIKNKLISIEDFISKCSPINNISIYGVVLDIIFN